MRNVINYSAVTVAIVAAAPDAKSFDHNGKTAFAYDYRAVTLQAEGELRYNDGDDLYYRHYQAGARFALSLPGEGWAGGIYYRRILKEDGQKKLHAENRPFAQLEKSFFSKENGAIPPLKWTWRFRQEYRMRDSDDSWRHRTRLQLKSQERYNGAKPFVRKEFYYDFDKDEFTRSRLDLGADFRIAGLPVKPKAYLRIDSNYRNNDWKKPELTFAWEALF